MLVYELEKQMPELNKLGCSQIEEFLQKNSIPFRNPIIGSVTINDSDAEKALTIYHALLAKKNEEERIAKEEAERKKRAMAQMLITSGFNFDGYRIAKYSGYISGDDAMAVDRGAAFTDGDVRNKLLASLTEIRRNALRELKEAAYELGCNAVIGVDFDYITIEPETKNPLTGNTLYQPYVFCVTANGNAVIIEKIED